VAIAATAPAHDRPLLCARALASSWGAMPFRLVLPTMPVLERISTR